MALIESYLYAVGVVKCKHFLRFQVFDAKRLIGREWSEASVQHDIKYFPFKVIDRNSKPHIKVDTSTGEEKVFAAEEISAMVLIKMKETAEAYLGKKVTHAVVTVPAVSLSFKTGLGPSMLSILGSKNQNILM